MKNLPVFIMQVVALARNVAADDACRILDFGPLLSGKRFEQHVIMRDRVLSEDMCQARCFMNARCFSINFNQTGDATDGKHVCELNDMSAEEGQDLAADRDFSYRGAEGLVTGFHDSGTRDQCVKFDFEHGISDWTKTGTAFDNQPTYGDNPTARGKGQPANQKGDWWIGGSEDGPSPSSPAGATQGDGPQGTLNSPTFRIMGAKLSFLIGGGCNADTVYAELLIDQVPVFKATGRCRETMEERDWDVSAHHGKQAQLRLVDNDSGGWGHINFDHMVDVELCE